MTSLKRNVFLCFLKMAENFENFEEFIPKWAYEDIEQSLVEAVDQYEEEENEKKSRFANVKNGELEEILVQAQSTATRRNTKWVVNVFEGELLLYVRI